jgi:hypothetical protein
MCSLVRSFDRSLEPHCVELHVPRTRRAATEALSVEHLTLNNGSDARDTIYLIEVSPNVKFTKPQRQEEARKWVNEIVMSSPSKCQSSLLTLPERADKESP